MADAGCYRIQDVDEIPSPALIVYRDVVEANIRRIGEILGGYERLRPHCKTHKMAHVARLQMAAGIDKFKCATPKEATMLAAAGAMDVVVSYPILGGAVERVVSLRRSHPQMKLTVISDDAASLERLSAACVEADVVIGVMIDLNTGMDRTGAPPGEPSLKLARQFSDMPGLSFQGLHTYDGHVSDPDASVRAERGKAAAELAVETRRLIEKSGIPVHTLVSSGTPGFEHAAAVDGVDEVSPGTWIFWDWGYGDMMPNTFEWAAMVLSRVISVPGEDLITLDAGNKAISPDVQTPYFRILGYPDDIEFVRRNEEHQVLRLPKDAPHPKVGEALFLVPRHVCTTVNLWDEAVVIDGDGHYAETWSVDARGH